jgi:hypothetical protein
MQVSYNWQVMLIVNNCSIRYKIKNALGLGYWNSLFYNQSSISHNSRIFTTLLRSFLVWFDSWDKVLPQNWSVKFEFVTWTVYWPVTCFQGLRTTNEVTMNFSDFTGLCVNSTGLCVSTQSKDMIQSSKIRGSLINIPIRATAAVN